VLVVTWLPFWPLEDGWLGSNGGQWSLLLLGLGRSQQNKKQPQPLDSLFF
jgi:hypothetical protein